MALDPVNGILAVPTQSNDIQIVDVNSGELMAKLTGHDSIITSIAFDAPRDRVATADEDGELRIWSIESGVVQSRSNTSAQSINDMTFDTKVNSSSRRQTTDPSANGMSEREPNEQTCEYR